MFIEVGNFKRAAPAPQIAGGNDYSSDPFGYGFIDGDIVPDRYLVEGRDYFRFSDNGREDKPRSTVYNIAVSTKGDSTRCFACCPGGHVYSGEYYDDLLHNMAQSLYREMIFKKSDGAPFDYKIDTAMRNFSIKPGIVRAKTSRGKVKIRYTEPASSGYAEGFEEQLRLLIQAMFNRALSDNMYRHEAYREGVRTPKSPKGNYGQNSGRHIKGKKHTEHDDGRAPFKSRFFRQYQM